MKYRILLKFLRILIYAKRGTWWVGVRLYSVAARAGLLLLRPIIVVRYKIRALFRRLGVQQGREWFLKRDFLQVAVFGVLFGLTISHTIVLARQDLVFQEQQTLAAALFGSETDYELEEVVYAPAGHPQEPAPSWRAGVISGQALSGAPVSSADYDLAVVAGGSAIDKPVIPPGAFSGVSRTQPVDYLVASGDSLSSIAYQFGVSVATIMWENKLTPRSLIRPGDSLKIPPASGVMHAVKKGETLKKIAALYGAKQEEIIAFNHLKEDGSDLMVGERLMIPNGIKPEERALIKIPRGARAISKIAVPPSSRNSPSLSGFIWPSAARAITQYFGWRHHAIDIAGPWQSTTFAAKAGMVEFSQCGWNRGYGCYVVINHGGGVKTLYGHHSQLLVSAGENVEAGQPIGLMGNTGHVRGRTGIHLHFEIIVNGARVNPLGYVR